MLVQIAPLDRLCVRVRQHFHLAAPGGRCLDLDHGAVRLLLFLGARVDVGVDVPRLDGAQRPLVELQTQALDAELVVRPGGRFLRGHLFEQVPVKQLADRVGLLERADTLGPRLVRLRQRAAQAEFLLPIPARFQARRHAVEIGAVVQLPPGGQPSVLVLARLRHYMMLRSISYSRSWR
ncbi:hypothetical protein D3C81_1164300 [compost metagenome]